MNMFKKGTQALSIIIFIVFVCLILVVNVKTPLIGEDFVLALPYEYQDAPSSVKLPLLFNKIKLQAQYWSARVGEQLAIIFASYDKMFFNILNTALFFFFCYFVVIFSKGEFLPLKEAYSYFLLALASSLIILLIPTLGEIFFWLDGSANYLWSIMILLLFFLPYRFLYTERDILEKKPILMILFYLLAILTGFSNENTVPAILAINILQFVVLTRKKNAEGRLPRWQWIGTMLCSTSFIIFVFLPSTRHRQEYYSNVYGTESPDLIYYLQRAKMIFTDYTNASYILILSVVGVFILFMIIYLIRKWKLTEESKKNFKVIAFILGWSYLSQFIMVIVPYYERRTGLLTWFFWLTLLFSIVEEFRQHKSPFIFASAIVLLFGLFQTVNVVKVYDQFYEEAMSRHFLLLNAEKEGVKEVLVEPFKTQYSRVITTREEYLQFENQLYANYYGLESVDIKSSSLEP
jgi:hypothetical protein